MSTASNPSTFTSCRLSPGRLKLLRPGVGRIFAAYGQYEKTGASPYSYPFLLLPNPALKQGRFDQEFMDEVLDLWRNLYPRFGDRPRLHLSYVQIAAAILAIRVAQDEIRHKKAKPWNGRQRKEASLLLARLERLRLQARRRLIADIGRARYQDLSSRWRELIRWIRMNLVYFRPWPAISKGGKLRRQIIDDAVLAARKRLEFLELKLPEPAPMRKVVRAFLRQVRRGRAAGRVRDLAHAHSPTVVAMVDYIRKRCNLERQPTESRLVMNIGQKPSQVTGASADATMNPPAAAANTAPMGAFVPKTRRFTKAKLRSLRRRWKKISKEQRRAAVEAWLKTGASRRELARHLKCTEGQIRWLLKQRKAADVPDPVVQEKAEREQLNPIATSTPVVPPIIPAPSAKPLVLSVTEGVALFLRWLDDQGGVGTYARGFFSEVRMKLEAKEHFHTLRPATYRLPPVAAEGDDFEEIIESCRPPGNPDDTSWTDYYATWAVEWLLRVCSNSTDREVIVEETERNAITPRIAAITW